MRRAWRSCVPILCGTITAAVLAYRVAVARRRRQEGAPRRLRSSSMGSTRFLTTGTMTLPTYDTIITVCAAVDPLPSVDVVQREWADVVLPHQRFHSVPHQAAPLGEVVWIAQRVDLAHHFFTHEASHDAAARELIDRLSNALLRDKSRPWWEVHLIAVTPSSPGTPTRGFVVLRVHHAIGDGASLMEALGPLLRVTKGDRLDPATAFAASADAAAADKRRSLDVGCFRRSRAAVGYAVSFVRQALRVIGLAAQQGDPSNRFCHAQWPYTGNRITVYFPSHRLSLIKAIRERAGCGATVNDVEFALFAGAVRRFLLRHDPEVALTRSDGRGSSMRALTPLAALETCDVVTKYSTLLRNTFTFVVNDLPLEPATALERLRASTRTWSALKSPAAVDAAFFVQQLAGRMPLEGRRQSLVDLYSRMSLVFSNVRGPQEEVTFGTGSAASRVEALHLIYPNLTPQVGVLSLNGHVHVCLSIAADAEGLDLGRVLPLYFTEELEELALALGIDASDHAP